MNLFMTILTSLRGRGSTAIVGAIFGWLSFDLLRTSQIIAAILAGLVSLCALILTAPKALREVRSWFQKP